MKHTVCRLVSLTAALLATSVTVYAQSAKLRVEGILCDSATHEPQAFATLRLMEKGAKGKPLRVATTQANGQFSLPVPRHGTFTLEAIVIGMQPLRREVTLTEEKSVVKLDTLYLKELSNTLATATVTAQKPLVRAEIDKLTYSMADDPEAQTNTTLEMLRKVPMVTVDGEDNIKVNGSNSFAVYVNGKPNKMMTSNPKEVLKSFPASTIKKVEVITNPGAKYDAEGVAGVLNIVTESQVTTSGYVVTPSLTFSNRGGNAGFFGMAQLGKLTLSAYYGAGLQKQPASYSTGEREAFDEDVNHWFTTANSQTNKSFFQHGNLDASYEFSPKDLLSVSVGLFGWKVDYDADVDFRMSDREWNPVYSYHQWNKGKMRSTNLNASADFQHTFAEDCNLTFSYRFGHNPTNNQTQGIYSDLVQVPQTLELLDRRTDPDQLNNEHTVQLDFTTPLGKLHTLSVGAKYISRLNQSDNTEWSRKAGSEEEFVRNEAQSIRFRHRGDIGAAYAEYKLKLKSWSMLAGCRYEFYHYRATYPDGKRPSFSSHLSDWVPSLSMAYSLTTTQMLKLGYNLRIARPSIDMLSPYADYSSPGNVSYGNPNLTSAQSHQFELAYNTFVPKLSLNLSLNYSFGNNGMTDYTFLKDGLLHSTYGEFLHEKVWNLNAYLNWTVGKSTSIFVNASGSYSDYRVRQLRQHNWGFAANGYGGVTQTLPWKLKFSLFGGGGSKSVSLEGKSPSYYFYHLNLSRGFLKDDRLTVSLGAGGFLPKRVHYTNITQTEQYRMITRSSRKQGTFSIGIRYRLGDLKASVRKVARSIENTDVKSTGGQGNEQGGAPSGM